ncbi:hypothetical protein S40285_00467 [Stachybotrys chlorohalonatus IBT 40285]|uniref:SP-RING-type domain-containing protein n=1 Tax=Stachybotrys chlorohalonatus (strain IBT 40285) TaxID=1283841 RepID=A0A084QNC0_STAC4|nr:hypothetical protein S40285_00467 [Stachybotrys chlorohalonata IBT 40285]
MDGLATTISRQDAGSLVKQIQGTQLLNRQLSSVCQVNGLKSTGVKADLQRRIINLIQETVNANDVSRFQQIRHSIFHASTQRSSPSKIIPPIPSRHANLVPPPQSPLANSFLHPMSSYNPSTTASSNGMPRDYHTSISNGHLPNLSYSSVGPIFSSSPFYHIEAPVTDLRTIEVMTNHKNSIHFSLKLSDHPALQRCATDKLYRVMIFCAADNQGVQHISFPQQAELRINGGEFKANLRGLKNKPGSTRPADITNALRLRPNYTNNVEFVYALTNKKYYLIANLCRITPVSELVTMIATRRRIPKATVVSELNKKAQDPDVVAMSQVLSLKCPLSCMRLDMPCRSLSCTHIQCFDATSYLQLQEQGPQWLCPICNKSAPFDQLAVDEYVKDILDNTSKSLETVTIEPNGNWLVKPSTDDKHGTSTTSTFQDEDDDLELSEISVVGGYRNETPKNSTPYLSTPVSAGRDGSSSAPRGIATTSGKRPASAVIDLTLSSDDDSDEPIQRPAKRQSTSVNGVRGPGEFDFSGNSTTEYTL